MKIRTHNVKSEFQAGDSTLEVLLPDGYDAARRYPVLYVLPAQSDESRLGNSLSEINQPDLICVRPVYNAVPWYADHPSVAGARQESHLLKAVLPFVERQYAIGERLLVGFSKSGWGAFSLLLRHPEVFHKAAAFDAPLLHDRPDRWGMADVFGTQENFEHYRITSLLEQRAALLREECRLVLIGYDSFQGHVTGAHELMRRLGIQHEYVAGPHREHRWDSGWLTEAIEGLLCSESKV